MIDKLHKDRHCTLMVRLRHYDDLDTARFVTFSCYRRYRLLVSEKTRTIILEEIDALRRKYGFHLLGYVIMPTHVHLVIIPKSSVELGRAIGELKSRSARRILNHLRLQNSSVLNKLKIQAGGETRYHLWEKRCYDHNCRSEETVIEKINYCHMNPVCAGSVADPAEWRWSSYGAYQGMPGGLIEIDTIEL